MGTVPQIPDWTGEVRVGAKTLNDAAYRAHDFLENRPYCCVTLADDYTHDAVPAEQALNFTNVVYDTDSMVRDGGIAPNTPGVYLITGQVGFTSTAVDQQIATRILVNGAAVLGMEFFECTPPFIGRGFIPFSFEIALNTGDFLQVAAYNSVAGLVIEGDSDRTLVGDTTHVKAVWVAPLTATTGALPAANPRTWVAGDVPTVALLNEQLRDTWRMLLSPPRALYRQNAAESIPNATTTYLTLNATAVWDTSTSLSGGYLVLPVDGFFEVHAQARFPFATTTGTRAVIVQYAQSGGTLIREYKQQQNASPGAWHRPHVNFVVSASAGQKLRLCVYQDSGGAQNIDNGWISYRWLGLGQIWSRTVASPSTVVARATVHAPSMLNMRVRPATIVATTTIPARTVTGTVTVSPATIVATTTVRTAARGRGGTIGLPSVIYWGDLYFRPVCTATVHWAHVEPPARAKPW